MVSPTRSLDPSDLRQHRVDDLHWKGEIMKKQKLVLRSETIRLLSEEVLDKVVGGYTYTENMGCGSVSCPGACTTRPCIYPD